MTQQSSQQINRQPELAEELQALSAREQIGILVRATRPLSRRDRVEIWRIAGFSVLRDRFLPVLLHLLLTRVLAGTLWWVLCGVAALVVLLVLAVVEQINPNAVTPVFAALVSFFIGFLLYALIDFFRSLTQFFKTTCPRSVREGLLTGLNAQDYAQKLALLRVLSASLVRKVPGESLLTSLITSLLLLFVGALLLGLVVLLSSILPILSSFPWVLLVAVLAFLLGLSGPGIVRHRLLANLVC